MVKMISKDTAMTTVELKKTERGSKSLKFLDRYIGIPLIFILGIFTLFRNKSIPTQVKKIALLKTAAIGDTVLLTSIIQDLKKNYPEAKIHFYSGNSNYGFAKLITDCEKVIQLPLKNLPKLYKILKSEKYDLLLDFGAWPKINSVCSFIIDADYKVGFKTKGQARHFVYDKKVLHSSEVHELENYRNILRSINLTVSSDLNLPQGTDISDLLMPVTKPFVVCHLWPGGEKSHLKEWPRDSWNKLMAEIIKTKDYEIVLTGGGEDKEKNLEFIATSNLKSHLHDFSGIKIEETISVIKKAAAVISVNTGVMHMAAASGTKTIGLHGPTSVKRWGPVGKNVYSVVSSLEGCQYLSLGFEYQPELKCMESIGFDDVLAVVRKIL